MRICLIACVNRSFRLPCIILQQPDPILEAFHARLVAEAATSAAAAPPMCRKQRHRRVKRQQGEVQVQTSEHVESKRTDTAISLESSLPRGIALHDCPVDVVEAEVETVADSIASFHIEQRDIDPKTQLYWVWLDQLLLGTASALP